MVGFGGFGTFDAGIGRLVFGVIVEAARVD